MGWKNSVIKREGYYECDYHKKARGYSAPIKVVWNTGGYFSGVESIFCNFQAVVAFAKKNPKICENCSGIVIDNPYFSRWVLKLIMENIDKMTDKVKEWEKTSKC